MRRRFFLSLRFLPPSARSLLSAVLLCCFLFFPLNLFAFSLSLHEHADYADLLLLLDRKDQLSRIERQGLLCRIPLTAARIRPFTPLPTLGRDSLLSAIMLEENELSLLLTPAVASYVLKRQGENLVTIRFLRANNGAVQGGEAVCREQGRKEGQGGSDLSLRGGTFRVTGQSALLPASLPTEEEGGRAVHGDESKASLLPGRPGSGPAPVLPAVRGILTDAFTGSEAPDMQRARRVLRNEKSLPYSRLKTILSTSELVPPVPERSSFRSLLLSLRRLSRIFDAEARAADLTETVSGNSAENSRVLDISPQNIRAKINMGGPENWPEKEGIKTDTSMGQAPPVQKEVPLSPEETFLRPE
ncbi:MAG: hypothetical protein K5657_08710, partial [Desulfovibrio sp.]|nr:hypothetical protein [Desulfovibrio sp.]